MCHRSLVKGCLVSCCCAKERDKHIQRKGLAAGRATWRVPQQCRAVCVRVRVHVCACMLLLYASMHVCACQLCPTPATRRLPALHIYITLPPPPSHLVALGVVLLLLLAAAAGSHLKVNTIFPVLEAVDVLLQQQWWWWWRWRRQQQRQQCWHQRQHTICDLI